MKIHLVTLIGEQIDVLPKMLAHYRTLGVDSFFVNVHVRDMHDPVLGHARAVTERFGCGIASVNPGTWQFLQQEVYARQREEHPDDWFILADQDELQRWPRDLHEILGYCERHGFDHVRGCLIDRLDREGRLRKLVDSQNIEEQFPLGGFVSFPILGADPLKVVAVRGALPVKPGQHATYSGRACPARDCFVPVHHFKWTEGLASRLARRAQELRSNGVPHWIESERFVRYYERMGRIDIHEPRLLIGECTPEYPHFEKVKKIVLSLD